MSDMCNIGHCDKPELQATIKELEEANPDAAEIIELRKACKIYKENGIDNRATITELEAALSLLDKNNFQHAKPYMVCVPVEVWRKAFPALKEDT